MKELIEYLKKAKANQWAIDFGDLAMRFNLSVAEVRKCVNEVYE
jgi:hypothetical protein